MGWVLPVMVLFSENLARLRVATFLDVSQICGGVRSLNRSQAFVNERHFLLLLLGHRNNRVGKRHKLLVAWQ